jgi:hypothetical protein
LKYIGDFVAGAKAYDPAWEIDTKNVVAVHSRPAVYGCLGRNALGGRAIYTIRRVAALREVSLVALPAYPATTASMATAARPETATRQRCREAIRRMRRARTAT